MKNERHQHAAVSMHYSRSYHNHCTYHHLWRIQPVSCTLLLLVAGTHYCTVDCNCSSQFLFIVSYYVFKCLFNCNSWEFSPLTLSLLSLELHNNVLFCHRIVWICLTVGPHQFSVKISLVISQRWNSRWRASILKFLRLSGSYPWKICLLHGMCSLTLWS